MSNDTNNVDEPASIDDIEAVRLMPGMFIGGRDQRALHTAILNLIGRAVYEASVHSNKRISVIIEPGNIVRVTDNGLGIPVFPDHLGDTTSIEAHDSLDKMGKKRISGRY